MSETTDDHEWRNREVRYTIREVCVRSRWFEIEDLIETLEAVEYDAVQVTNRELGKTLVSEGVLTSMGSQRAGVGATKGPVFQEFLEEMKRIRDDNAR